MKTIERIPTGIPGLDEMIEDGLLVPSITLVARDGGTGKPTFFNQFLCEGAERKEPADLIRSEIIEFQSNRVVLCNPSEFELILKDEYRRFLLKLTSTIKGLNKVALIAGETGPGYPYLADIAHIADGIILLHNTEAIFVRRRSIEILKMKGTPHPSGKHSIDITTKGLSVYPGLQL